MTKKYEGNRKAYKSIIYNLSLSKAIRLKAQNLLNALPKDSAKVRINNRCILTGRSKSVYQSFNISRIKLREQALLGNLPGMQKSSW